MAMYFSDEDIELLQEEVTPLMAIQALGIETRKQGSNLSILCPSPDHNDQHFGSCMIMHHGRVCKCFACGRSFTSLQIIMMETGCGLYEGMCTLAEIAGMEDCFNASKQQVAKKVDKMLPNTVKQQIGLAIYSKIANILNNSDCREDDSHYLRANDGSYLKVNGGNWKPWNDLRKEDPETFEWLVRNKCKEKLLSIDMLRKKIRSMNGAEISSYCYDLMKTYEISPNEILQELDQIYNFIETVYVEHGGKIKDSKVMALNVLGNYVAYT